MTAPAPYNRVYNFTGFQAASPQTPLPATQVDAELSAIKITTDAIIATLALIQRSDGQLANASVGPVQLSAALSTGITPASAWSSAGVTYNYTQCVFVGFKLYVCIVATSVSTPAAPPNTNTTEWALLADFTANAIPAGSVITASIADQSVTTAKLALSSVTAAQLGAAAVGTTALAPLGVTGAKIAASTIDFSKITASGLPTTLPAGSGVWWLDGGVLSLSP